MEYLVKILALVVFLTIANAQLPRSFRCWRDGGCSGVQGTCNPDGTCTCAVGFVFHDCSQAEVACIPPQLSQCEGHDNAVNQICNNGKCMCKLGYTGSDCNDRVYERNPQTFKCWRDGGCSGEGTCNNNDGTCTCDAGFVSHDCFQANVTCTPPQAVACQALDNNVDPFCNNGKCMCELGYTGPDCSEQVSVASCDADNFHLLYGGAGGFGSQTSVSPCGNEACTIGGDYGAGFAIPMDPNTCGVSVTANQGANSDQTWYEVCLIVRRNPGMSDRGDDKIVLRCMFDSIAFDYTAEILPDVNTQADRANDGGSIVYELTGDRGIVGESEWRDKESTDSEWLSVTPSIDALVADFFRLKVKPDPDTAVQAVRLEDCWVDGGEGTTEIRLVEDACLAEGGYQHISEFRGVDGYKTVGVYVYKDLTSDVLRLRCDVRKCLQGDDSCDPETCDAPPFINTPMFGGGVDKKRKRRAADTSGITATITITGGTKDTLKLQNGASKHECTTSREFIIVVAILCMLVLVLAIACVFFFMRSMSQRRSRVDDLKTVYTNS